MHLTVVEAMEMKLAVLLFVLLHVSLSLGAGPFKVVVDEDCVAVRNETECGMCFHLLNSAFYTFSVCHCAQASHGEIIKYAYCDNTGRLLCSDTPLSREGLDVPYFPACVCPKVLSTHECKVVILLSVEGLEYWVTS